MLKQHAQIRSLLIFFSLSVIADLIRNLEIQRILVHTYGMPFVFSRFSTERYSLTGKGEHTHYVEIDCRGPQ